MNLPKPNFKRDLVAMLGILWVLMVLADAAMALIRSVYLIRMKGPVRILYRTARFCKSFLMLVLFIVNAFYAVSAMAGKKNN